MHIIQYFGEKIKGKSVSIADIYVLTIDVVFQQISTFLVDSVVIVFGLLINSFYYIKLFIKEPSTTATESSRNVEIC